MQAETDGYFSLWSPSAQAGERYRLRLDRGEIAVPDPASRFQPEGPHGPSAIIDPNDFPWTDKGWLGRPREQLVIYEMHVGTFTPEGNWEAASQAFPALAELGITCLEIMPVAEFAGQFGWGYDGVSLFAPTHLIRPARRFSPLCRWRPCLRNRCHPRRRVQSYRPERELFEIVFFGVFHEPLRQRVGRGAQL